MTTYTIGEIFRLGLLLNNEGKPYAQKATVAKIVSTLHPTKRRTPWGEAKCLTLAQIKQYNKTSVISPPKR